MARIDIKFHSDYELWKIKFYPQNNFVECQTFPGNIISWGRKFFQTEHCREENSGTRKFEELNFFQEFEEYFLRKFKDFFCQGRKFQDF